MRGVTHREASVGGQQLKAVLHVNELPLDCPVVAAEVVERGVQLLQFIQQTSAVFPLTRASSMQHVSGQAQVYICKVLVGISLQDLRQCSSTQVRHEQGSLIALPA